jgi:hypothetical protein
MPPYYINQCSFLNRVSCLRLVTNREYQYIEFTEFLNFRLYPHNNEVRMNMERKTFARSIARLASLADKRQIFSLVDRPFSRASKLLRQFASKFATKIVKPSKPYPRGRTERTASYALAVIGEDDPYYYKMLEEFRKRQELERDKLLLGLRKC